MNQLLYFNFNDENEFVYDTEEEEEQEKEENKKKELSNINNSINNSLDSIEDKDKIIKIKKIKEEEKVNKSLSSSEKSKEFCNENSSSESKSDNSYLKSFERENDSIKNNYDNKEYNNLLNYIIDKEKIVNSIIISKNFFFINMIMEKIVEYNISKNKKICYLITEIKKAKNIYENFKDKREIRPLILQKIKSKKNDYPNFRELINENNIFILNPNVLYKLLSIGFIKISDFGLMIFDECHQCDAGHTYNLIMQEFYFYYINKKIKIQLPNIIGFTDSPYKDKNIIKNKNKYGELLKNISENLNCQIIIDPFNFKENKEIKEKNTEYIKVDNHLKEINKINGINIILMKYFFEDMFNLCLKDYIKMNGETNEIKGEKKIEIKQKYINTLKMKFISEDFVKYNNIEASERNLHFLSKNSILFKTFEDMQKHLINIIHNFDLEEIYKFFEKYNNLNEQNLKKEKENNDIYMQKQYKRMIIIFKICMHAFKRLLDKNVEYKTDRINKFINKLNDIYTKNKNNKSLIFVSNRKIANILFNYLNRDKKENNFRNKSKYIVGTNYKNEENISLTLATRRTAYEIKEIIKEYMENKINILICSPSTIEYLDKIECDSILIFNEELNSSKCYDKIKDKSKTCKSEFIIFGEKSNNFNDSYKIKKEKEYIQLKELFLEGNSIKNPKDFKDNDFIKKKYNDKIFYYYISETEAKISLKNCMMLYNEINNIFISKGVKINIEKNTSCYQDREQQFICNMSFQCGNDYVQILSNVYNDKQSAENECYLKYIIYLHQKKLIDNNFQLLL